MDVHRLYIDSRGRVSGDASESAFKMGMDITIPKDSVAVLDTVAIPVSWYTVERGVNDRIYMSEARQGVRIAHFIALIEPSYYYDMPAMAAAIQKAINDARVFVIDPYTVTYNSLSGCFEVFNLYVGAFEATYIYSRYALLAYNSPSNWGADPNNLMGAVACMGMVTGQTAFGGQTMGATPVVLNRPPGLQNKHQLFIRGSLGMPGAHVQVPGDQVQDILRRVAITAPLLSVNIDRSTNYFDTINVPPGTL